MRCSNIMPNIGVCNKPEVEPVFKCNGFKLNLIDYDITSENTIFDEAPNGNTIRSKKGDVVASLSITHYEYEKVSKEFWNNNMAGQVWRIEASNPFTKKRNSRKVKSKIYNRAVSLGYVTFKEINDIKVNRYKYKIPTAITINEQSFKITERWLSVHEDYNPSEYVKLIAKLKAEI